MNDHELDLALSAMGQQRTAVADVPELHELVRSTAATTPQQRGFLPPFTGRFQSMFSATKFVVAGVIVALFSGFLLAGVLTQQSGDVTPAAVGSAFPEATPSTPFELPAVIPDGIESGTADTPLGTARWVHLSGDRDSRPNLNQAQGAFEWPTGIAVFEPPDGGRGIPGSKSYAATIRQPSRLWASGNGIDWELQPLPTPADAHWASLTLVDGVYWLIANVWSGDRLWRSSDGVTWEELDSSGLVVPGPVGLDWNLDYTRPATTGDLTLILRSGGGWVPFEDLGMHPECREDMGWLAPGLYESSNDELNCPTLRFTETETGLQVTDDITEEVLGEIVGADLSHISAMEFDGPQQLLIIGDGEVTLVGVPWPGSGHPVHVELHGTERGIYAYAANDPTVWGTTDGRSWTELGPPGFLDDTTARAYPWFTALPGLLSATIFGASGEGGGPGVGWETVDGIDWRPAPGGRPEGTTPLRFESGWFASENFEIGEELWMHLGDAWVSLSELGMERPDERCWGAITAAGSTTILRDLRCPAHNGQGNGMWILTMDPSG